MERRTAINYYHLFFDKLPWVRRSHCRAGATLAPKQKINAMNDTTVAPYQAEEEILIHEIPDEALETAAGSGTEAANMTFEPIWCPAAA